MNQVALPRRRWAARHRESQQHEVSVWREQDRFQGSQPIGWHRIGGRAIPVSKENGPARLTSARMDRPGKSRNNRVSRLEAREGSSRHGYGVSRSSLFREVFHVSEVWVSLTVTALALAVVVTAPRAGPVGRTDGVMVNHRGLGAQGAVWPRPLSGLETPQCLSKSQEVVMVRKSALQDGRGHPQRLVERQAVFH